MTLNDTDAIHNRVPAHEVIKDDAEAMVLFQSLHAEVDGIKNLIKEIIPTQQHRSFILTTIWFFATTNPKIAHELVAYLQKWDIEKFTYLVYQHIFDALELRKQHLKIEGHGSPGNPGKADIDDLKRKICMLQELVNPDNISWVTVPTVDRGLVPTERINI